MEEGVLDGAGTRLDITGSGSTQGRAQGAAMQAVAAPFLKCLPIIFVENCFLQQQNIFIKKFIKIFTKKNKRHQTQVIFFKQMY